MKQFLFILLLIQGYLHAQHPVWPQPGAEWELCRVSYPDFQESYTTTPPIRYEKDTIIDDVTYQITRKFKENGQIMIDFFTRFEQDTIFRYVNGNEYMFFTYNVDIDDKLFPLRTGIDDYNEDTCSYTLELLCLDIYPINIDGNMLNLYEFLDVGNSIYGLNGSSGETRKYYWIEIIGWVSNFPWLIVESELTCNNIEFDGGGEFPIHYSDATRSWSIEFQENGLVCDTLLSIRQEHIEDISIYPNPTSGKTTFRLAITPTDDMTITLTDLQGRILKTVNVSQRETELDLNLLNDGVYLVHLIKNNKIQSTKKLIYAN